MKAARVQEAPGKICLKEAHFRHGPGKGAPPGVARHTPEQLSVNSDQRLFTQAEGTSLTLHSTRAFFV